MTDHARLDELLNGAANRLAGHVATPELEAELLLAHVLGRGRSYLRAWPERVLDADRRAAFENLIARRLGGEPVAYLTGEREFWSLRLRVKPGVLIPRAETERLVECALAHLPENTTTRVADLGTGSGAVALALASERPRAQVVATDRSETALIVARDNARRLGLERIEFRKGDWLAALADSGYDLIVSNPPYIAENDPHLRQGDLPAEPPEALSAGPDGLNAIRRIVIDALVRLRTGGWLLLEHGYDQGLAVRALLAARGYEKVQTYRDLEGHERVTLGRRPTDDPAAHPV